MSKLYVFGIGGTGSRVLRSLTHLLAAGVDCGVNTIVPIIIDRDMGNADLTRTELLIKDYIKIKNTLSNPNQAQGNTPNSNVSFFKTEIKLLNGKLGLQLQDNSQKFENFIGKSTMPIASQALVDTLFSRNTLNLDMTAGFQGNPNIGSIVLNQFDNNDVFLNFANDFQQGDQIFIISSIFGGTGASGFPLLRKTLHTPNLEYAQGNVLPNWGLINTAHIGAISVLPYFNVDPPTDGSLVDGDTFVDKARAALSYYKTEDGKIDTFYYIADNTQTTYEHNTGGASQKNNAHFVELASALAILDFVNPINSGTNFQRDNNNKITATTYKEFGIKTAAQELNFDHLADVTNNLIVNPLTRFLLFTKYMGYGAHIKSINGIETPTVEHLKDRDVFSKESKHQPYAYKRFDNDFRNSSFMKTLENIQLDYTKWFLEMEEQSHKFSPFNLYTDYASHFTNGNLTITNKNKSLDKGWSKVDDVLNKQISKVSPSLENESRLIELFDKATKELINFKN